MSLDTPTQKSSYQENTYRQISAKPVRPLFRPSSNNHCRLITDSTAYHRYRAVTTVASQGVRVPVDPRTTPLEQLWLKKVDKDNRPT
jgi:hypothetical protein